MHEYKEKYGNHIGAPECSVCHAMMAYVEPAEAAAVAAIIGQMEYGRYRSKLIVVCRTPGCLNAGVEMNIMKADWLRFR